MELHRAIDCIEYVGQDPKIPALRIEITEPIGESRVALTAPLDTGFAGHVLVDRTTYERLGTAELPREEFGRYQTMAGPVVLRRSRIALRLAKKEFESYLETPLYGPGRLLLGRLVLSRLDLALFGISARCCRLVPERGE